MSASVVIIAALAFIAGYVCGFLAGVEHVSQVDDLPRRAEVHGVARPEPAPARPVRIIHAVRSLAEREREPEDAA